MVAETPAEVWAAGDAYEPYVGRWSRFVARAFLHWLVLPSGLAWLDVGCGTGALSRTILDDGAPRSVLAVDSSAGYLDYARAHVRDLRLAFRIGDAEALPLPDRAVDAAVSDLVLNFVADAARALSEMRRVVRPGGAVALYVWDYAGRMQMMRHFWNAAIALDPAAETLDEGRRFPICNPAALSDLFRSADLVLSCRHRRPHDRRADRLPRFRGLLDAVPRRTGAGAGLLHESVAGATRGVQSPPARYAADAKRRPHCPDRPRLRSPGHRAGITGSRIIGRAACARIKARIETGQPKLPRRRQTALRLAADIFPFFGLRMTSKLTR